LPSCTHAVSLEFSVSRGFCSWRSKAKENSLGMGKKSSQMKSLLAVSTQHCHQRQPPSAVEAASTTCLCVTPERRFKNALLTTTPDHRRIRSTFLCWRISNP
ncbi:unnamed protein product, partial [Ectocarpus sp. 8 AP-2014]